LSRVGRQEADAEWHEPDRVLTVWTGLVVDRFGFAACRAIDDPEIASAEADDGVAGLELGEPTRSPVSASLTKANSPRHLTSVRVGARRAV
jgi:hypothetical protein